MRAALTAFALWAAGLGAAAQFGKVSVAIEALGLAYPLQAGFGIGVMLSVVGMVGLVLGTTAGVLVVRLGARRTLLGALGLGAAISLLQAMLPAYPVMLASRVLEGLSHLAIVVIGPTAIAGLANERWQGAAMTLWSSFFGVTYAVLFLIGPPLVAAEGAGALFVAHSLWMAGCAGALALLMPADPPAAPRVQPLTLWQQHRRIYASAWLAAPAMGFFCYAITYVALLTLLPTLMGSQGALAGVAMPLVSIVVSLTLGVWLLRFLTAVRLVQLGFALAILAALGLWAGWQGALALPFALLVSSALGIVQGASFASLAALNDSPDARAEAAGAIAQLGNLGTTLGTPLLIVVVTAADVAGLALFVLVFSALGIAVHTLQARRRAMQPG